METLNKPNTQPVKKLVTPSNPVNVGKQKEKKVVPLSRQEGLLSDRNGNPLLGPQQVFVAHATAEADFKALSGKVNAILDILEAHGLMASA